MFSSAYVRLSAWYVAIIMTLSLAFSVWVYSEATKEIRLSLERLRQSAFSDSSTMPPRLAVLLEDQLESSRQRIQLNLIYLNVFVFGLGAAGSYILARRTMRPIEEAMEAQKQFTADASHELRTPLTAMKTDIEVTLRDPQPSEREIDRLLKSNLEEIDRLSKLAEGLLTLAQHDELLATEPVPLDELVQAMCQRLQPLAATQQIALECQTQTVVAKARRAPLEKVLSILIDNAIKYSSAHTSILVSCRASKGAAQLSVKDHGQGMDRASLERIFDRFYRADTARSSSSVAGYGLGLAIAKKVVLALCGTITVTSKPGKGSTFTVRLPLYN